MLEATHTAAPWTLVDFNDQRRGRLALIRHLLDAVPDTRCPSAHRLSPAGARAAERAPFKGPLRPI
jgi:hypothetical protein